MSNRGGRKRNQQRRYEERMWKCDYKSQHLVKVNDLQLKETGREQQKDRKKRRERGSILCCQPHATLLSMLRGQSCDKPTTPTREGVERQGGGTNRSMKEMKEKGWIKTKASLRDNVK